MTALKKYKAVKELENLLSFCLPVYTRSFALQVLFLKPL